MNAKRLIALMIAVLMLVCMFSACGDNKTDDKGSSSTGTSKPSTDDKKDDEEQTDAPDSTELYDFSWLGYGELDSTTYPLTVQGIIDGEYEVTNQFLAISKEYGLNYEINVVPSEIYANTINSLASTGDLPSAFFTRGVQGGDGMDETTLVQWIEQGMLLSCNETMKYSSGNMQRFFGEEDGAMRWAYAWCQYVDGDWYMVAQANNTAYNMDIQESDGELRVPTQIHGPYHIMYRQNWLDDLGLSMPTNPDEFYETSLAIHEGDANGNGLTDERVFMGLGDTWQYQGIGCWYGLPFQDFIEDPSDGHIEVACLCDGFVDWASYMNKLYDVNLTQVNDGGHPWRFSTYFAENNVIAWYCMTPNVRAAGVSVLGEGTDYEPMPIVTVEGYKTRMISQEAIAASYCYSARSDVDPKAFAAYVDFLYSEEVFMLAYFGVEGESYQWNDDGTITSWGGRSPNSDTKTVEDQYKNMHGVLYWCGICPLNQNGNCWIVAGMGGHYDSIADAVADDAGYKENNTTRENWMQVNNWYTDDPNVIMLNRINEYGEENINWQAYYSYMCLPTADQSNILSAYGTDLKTYILELGTKLVTGDYSLDQVDELIQNAYDTYHLQEYIDVLQENASRFMEALNG